MNVWTLALIGAAAMMSACAGNLSERWSATEAARVDGYMDRCERREDNSTLLWECGLTYQFAATTTPLDHKTYVEQDVAATVEAGVSGAVEKAEHRGEQTWAGGSVDVSMVRYKGRKGTITQPSVEFYVSQVIDGERQMFTCWHTLAMVTGEDQLKKRLFGCVKGLKVLTEASR